MVNAGNICSYTQNEKRDAKLLLLFPYGPLIIIMSMLLHVNIAAVFFLYLCACSNIERFYKSHQVNTIKTFCPFLCFLLNSKIGLKTMSYKHSTEDILKDIFGKYKSKYNKSQYVVEH